MLPDATLPVPASLASLLAVFGPLFTAPSFRTFCDLACGFLSQAGKRTVCGMLAGAGLAAKLRRVIIAARFKASRPDQPTPEEISVLRLAWEDLAA